MNDVIKWLSRAGRINERIKAISMSKVDKELRVSYVSELRNVRREIFQCIRKMENAECQILIIKKYIDLKSWEEIAEFLDISVKWARTGLHSKALKEVGKILNANENK